MSNIDEFNRLTLNVLDSLYESFPQHSVINSESFYEKVDDFAAANMEGTMSFLKDEGFIKYGDAAEGRIYVYVQLTLKGLGLLKRVPDSVEVGQTISDRIKGALKLGTKEAFKEAIKFIISEGMKGQIVGS